MASSAVSIARLLKQIALLSREDESSALVFNTRYSSSFELTRAAVHQIDGQTDTGMHYANFALFGQQL